MQSSEKDLLRFITAGSVDDGKSTLIGRLLFECEGIYEDQLQSVRAASARKGTMDLSLITDGLRAEREQGITIDVAYRYFSTPKRKFIIADAPGHEQYTRNMVTAASRANLALLLVDARKGILQQTRRHAYIAWLLGIRRLVVVVNKMDLVGFDATRFAAVCEEFAAVNSFLAGTQVQFVPVSALAGDNVCTRSGQMPWYEGPVLLELLESIPIEKDRNLTNFRFPVQNVIRASQDFRGYAGQIASGTVKPGQEVISLSSLQKTRVDKVFLYDRELEEAFSPQSIVLTLQDHIDLGRGDVLAALQDMPKAARRFRAQLIWISAEPLKKDCPYLMKHTTQVLCCSVVRIHHRKDIQSFQNYDASTFHMNEIGAVEIETHKPLFFDSYESNRRMGSFILIDTRTNDTVAAGILDTQETRLSDWSVESAPGRASHPHPAFEGMVVWLTGLSGAGKTTIGRAVHTELLARGMRVEMLDGDDLRKHLNSDLGFSKEHRDENVRRIGFVARLLARHGVVVLVCAISPYRAVRDEVRRSSPLFIEVHVNASLQACELRDPKGLYKKARAKEIPRFTAIDDPYEPPLSPDVQCHTEAESIKASADKVIAAVLEHSALSMRNLSGEDHGSPFIDSGNVHLIPAL